MILCILNPCLISFPRNFQKFNSKNQQKIRNTRKNYCIRTSTRDMWFTLALCIPFEWVYTNFSVTISDERISWNGHKQISEYIQMPHYVPNKYLNIFKCNIFTKRTSEYICTLEIARIHIRIICASDFITIFVLITDWRNFWKGLTHASSK